MKLLEKQLGTFVPVKNRTSWKQEFTGMTVRQWIFVPIRAVAMLPLLLIIKTSTAILATADVAFEWVDSNCR